MPGQVYSETASLCSAKAAQASTFCPGHWGGRWGHVGQPPWESGFCCLCPCSCHGNGTWSAGPSFRAPQCDNEARLCFSFCSLPLLPLHPQVPTQCNPSPFLRKLPLSLKHQKGTGVTPHPLWGLRLNKIMGVEGQTAQRNLLRAVSTIYGHLKGIWLGPKDQAVFYWRFCAFFCCW